MNSRNRRNEWYNFKNYIHKIFFSPLINNSKFIKNRLSKKIALFDLMVENVYPDLAVLFPNKHFLKEVSLL